MERARTGAFLSIALAMAVLAGGAACGTQPEPGPGAAETPTQAATIAATQGEALPDIGARPAENAATPAAREVPQLPGAVAEVGNDVGDRVPEFALLLAGGETVTSEELRSAGRPVFLYFYFSW